ncbi:hypothetical protein ENBRE01_0969 [Enteropsectra breve]|nr:hypothetical protein ENBRE01_0969 [Enteropsectra breve]
MFGKITKEVYLNKDFDYTKLTKLELRQIMSENGVKDIPPPSALKSVITEAYRKEIHDKIDMLKDGENVFQSPARGKKSANPPPVEEEILSKSSSGSTQHPAIQIKFPATEQLDSPRRAKKSETKEAGNASKAAYSEYSDASKSILSQRSARSSPQRKGYAGDRKEAQALHEIHHAKESGHSHKETKINSLHANKSNSEITKSNKLVAFIKCMLNISAVLFILLTAYLKYFCPYCTGGENVCIPLPQNSYLDGGILKCKQGYKLNRGFVVYCEQDKTKMAKAEQKAKQIISMLMHAKGEYEYGSGRKYKFGLESIAPETELLELLKHSKEVVLQGTEIYARESKVYFRTVFRYYVIKSLKIIAPMLSLLLVLKIFLYRRRKANEMRKDANVVAKDVFALLSRQLVYSSQSALYKPYLLESQLKDALEIKEDLWRYVKDIVRKNSNVQERKNDGNLLSWTWIGPALYKQDLSEKSLQSMHSVSNNQ